MRHLLASVLLFVAWVILAPNFCGGSDQLTVASDYEGASVRVLEIDEASRSVSFTPGGDPQRGWPCWWYFRIDGIKPDETITLRLQGSTAAHGEPVPGDHLELQEQHNHGLQGCRRQPRWCDK